MPPPTNAPHWKFLLPSISHDEAGKRIALLPIDPHRQTIRDLQIYMIQHLQDACTVNLTIDGN
jgi:hypothetical protein